MYRGVYYKYECNPPWHTECCELAAMVVLKNIPRILSPELLSVLARMGHGDEIGNGLGEHVSLRILWIVVKDGLT